MVPVLLLVLSAVAHQPHDVAAWVAVPPGPEPAGMATTLRRNDGWIVARTSNLLDFSYRYLTDMGTTWAWSGRYLSSTRLVVGTDGQGLLVSEDGGDHFAAHPTIGPGFTVVAVEPSPDVLADGVALAAGGRHVWRTGDGGDSWSMVADGIPSDVVAMDLSPSFSVDGRVGLLTAMGHVMVSSDGGLTWLLVGGPGGVARSVSLGDADRLWVGTDDGLWRSEDLGETWSAGVAQGEPVPVVEDLGVAVMATTGLEAAWVSTDGGDTWALRAEGLPSVQLDQPGDGIHFFDLVQGADGRVWLAAWEGPTWSDDLGQHWFNVETEPIANLRAVVLTRGHEGALAALLGSYGGGVEVVGADGSWARAASLTLNPPFVRHAAATDTWGVDGFALVTSADQVFATVDGGATWTGSTRDVPETAERVSVARGETGPVGLVVGKSGGQGAVSMTWDLGASWVPGVLDVPCSDIFSDGHLSDGFAEDGRGWTACLTEGHVYRTVDGGATWQILADLGQDVYRVVGTPGGERLFVGARNGLYVADGDEPPVLMAFEGSPVFGVGLCPRWDEDPSVLAIVLGDGWYLSDDGGETWSRLDAPVEDVVKYVSFSPDYPEDGSLAVAGYNGGWISRDRGGSWRQIHTLEVVQESHPTWTWSGWSGAEDPAASAGWTKVADAPGATATLAFQGVGVDLLARAGGGGGRLGLSVDGGPVEEVALDGMEEALQSVWSVSDLPDARHALVVEALDGGLAVDAAVVWRQALFSGGDAGLEDTAPGDTAPGDTAPGNRPNRPAVDRCGCNAPPGTTGFLTWLPAMLALFRPWRRPRPPRRPRPVHDRP